MTMNNEQYRRQVALLIRIMPAVFRIQDFAVHGGTAINLFHQNMPRYSVDIDVTYIPIAPRETSLEEINAHLSKLKTNIERTIPGVKIIHRPDVWKLQCAYQGATAKIEVNGTKRGLLGESEVRDLCPKAQARRVLIDKAGAGLNERDRLFLLSFEQGAPLWEHCVSGDLSHFPAVQWKIQNIQKLKARNPLKHQEGVKKLADFLGITSTSV